MIVLTRYSEIFQVTLPVSSGARTAVKIDCWASLTRLTASSISFCAASFDLFWGRGLIIA